MNVYNIFSMILQMLKCPVCDHTGRRPPEKPQDSEEARTESGEWTIKIRIDG
jgi:hypothetical protein